MGAFLSLVQPALDSVKGIIEQFHLSPEEHVQAEQAIADAAAKAQIDSQNYEVQLNSIASANVRADAQSGDKFTQRARPTFLYLMYFILLFNFFALPLIQFFAGKVLAPVQLPSEMWFMFSTGYLGYVCARSVDKQQALPGASELKLPFGMSASNHS